MRIPIFSWVIVFSNWSCFVTRVVTVGVEIFHNGKWICLPRSDDNFFLMGSRNGIKFPLRVRLTSISGEQVESTITELKNDVDIASSVQFSGFIKGIII